MKIQRYDVDDCYIQEYGDNAVPDDAGAYCLWVDVERYLTLADNARKLDHIGMDTLQAENKRLKDLLKRSDNSESTPCSHICPCCGQEMELVCRNYKCDMSPD